MKKIKFTCPEDFTEENITAFKNEIYEIQNTNIKNVSILDNLDTSNFDSIESYMEYYGLIPFEEFDRKFRGEEGN